MLDSVLVYGSIAPDTYSPGRDPGSLWFTETFLHSAKDSGIKKGDNVTYTYHFSRTIQGYLTNEANDIQVIVNG